MKTIQEIIRKTFGLKKGDGTSFYRDVSYTKTKKKVRIKSVSDIFGARVNNVGTKKLQSALSKEGYKGSEVVVGHRQALVYLEIPIKIVEV